MNILCNGLKPALQPRLWNGIVQNILNRILPSNDTTTYQVWMLKYRLYRPFFKHLNLMTWPSNNHQNVILILLKPLIQTECTQSCYKRFSNSEYTNNIFSVLDLTVTLTPSLVTKVQKPSDEHSFADSTLMTMSKVGDKKFVLKFRTVIYKPQG